MSNLFKYDDEKVINLVKRQLAYIEAHNKREYPTPNSNYQNVIRNCPDVLGAYADELVELRKVAMNALNICIDVRETALIADSPGPDMKMVNKLVKFVTDQPWYKLSSNSKR